MLIDVAKIPSPLKTTDPNRVAAEWVLGIGGTIETDAGKFTEVGQLPKKPFQTTIISVSEIRRVTDDDLEHLKELTNLTHLNLTGTQVGDTGPVHLKKLANLRYLILEATRVGDAGLEHLKGLTKLGTLNLLNTKVTAQGVTDLQKALPDCKIDWDGSAKSDANRAVAQWVLGIGGFIETEADKFTEVGQLPNEPFQIVLIHLARNQKVTDADLERFKGLTNLKDVQLSDTQITDAGLAHLGALPNLMHLHLGGTKVRGAGLVHLKRLPKLTTLALYRTKINDEGLEHLQGLTTLTFLNLTDTQVSDAGIEHLKGLTNLRDLRLADMQISDAGLEQLKPLKNLTDLYIGVTQVSDAGLEHLKGLTKLTKLELRGTKVTAQGIAEFKKARPKCNIKWDSPAKSDPNRATAKWVLGIGGTIETEAGKFTAVGQLPKQPFEITLVNLKGKQQVSDDDLVKLKGLTNLTALELSSTRITDNGLGHLKKLTNLKHLRLSQAKVTAKGIAELQKALPNCEIKEP
jgi:Leucine-rich repeat (LRR) protein